ncbi:MAG: sigma-70 family RNA polymerase sigma factor [Odoribacter sp.]
MEFSDNYIFKTFYLRNFKTISGFCNSYLKDSELARDVAQEVFFKLYQNRLQLTTEEHARTWMYLAAKNLCIDHLRKLKFRPETLNEIPEAILSDNYFLDQITEQEAIRNIQLAINNLPEQTRKIILLSIQEKSNAEIAEILNISINSVKTLKKNGYQKLRQILKNEYIIFLLTGFLS